MPPDQQADYAATETLIAWAFAERQQLKVLEADPVWRWYHAVRAPKLERLRVVFEQQSEAPALCTPCGKCCRIDARFVVHAYDVLGWAALGQPKAMPLAPVETSCLFLGPQGCVLGRDARPTLCSTFTCSTVDAAIDTSAVNMLRTPLWGYTQAAARYLARTYVLESSTQLASLTLSAADLHGFFENGPVHLRRADEARRDLPLLPALKRHHGQRFEWPDRSAQSPPEPEQDAPSFLNKERLRRAGAHQRAESLLTTPLAEITAPQHFAEIVAAARAAHVELTRAQRDYAQRFCVTCPEAGPKPPLPGNPGYEKRRQAVFSQAAMRGRYKPSCMYHHCASGARLNEFDVSAWRALSRHTLPVLDKPAIGRCSLLGEHGCGVEAEARSPSCDRFACHRAHELPDPRPLIAKIERAYRRSDALFEVIRSAYGAHQSHVEYPAAPRQGEPLFD